MAEDDASKTEDPTAKKLAKARSEGQVAQSNEIKSWFILLGSGLIIFMMAPGIARDLQVVGGLFIEQPDAIPFDNEHLRRDFADVLLEIGIIMAPAFGLLMVLALAANVGQTGFIYSPKKMQPKLERISVLKGFKRLFSLKSVAEFVKGILKLTIVTIVASSFALPLLQDIALIPDMDLLFALDRIHALAVELIIGTVAVMTVIALLDFSTRSTPPTNNRK